MSGLECWVPPPKTGSKNNGFTDLSVGDFTNLGIRNGKGYSWGNPVINTGSLKSNRMPDEPSGSPGSQTLTPTLINLGEIPKTVEIVSFARGRDHTLALASDGKVYAYGTNSSGQLGNPLIELGSDTFVPVNLPSSVKIAQISAGGNTSLALTTNGKVYGWGDNQNNQITTEFVNQYDTPIIITISNKRVTAIASGGLHSLAIISNELFGWGDSSRGQLGIIAPNPGVVKIGTSKSIMQVAGGSLHTVMLDSKGVCFGCGDNSYGQLGNSDEEYDYPIEIAKNVSQIAAGTYHTLFLTRENKLYGCGDNSQKQISENKEEDEISTPYLIKSGVKIMKISAGGYTSGLAYAKAYETWGLNETAGKI